MPTDARLVCKFIEFPSSEWWSKGASVRLRWALPPLEGTINCAEVTEPGRRLPLYTTLPVDFSVNIKDEEIIDHAESSATVSLSVHCAPPPPAGETDPLEPTVYRFEVALARITRVNASATATDPEHGARLHHVLIAVDQATRLCPSFTLAPTPRRSVSTRRYKADADKWVSALFAQLMLSGVGSHSCLVENCEAFLAAKTRVACGLAAHGLVAAMYSAVVNMGSDSKLRSLIARSLYKLAVFLPGYEAPQKRQSMRSSPHWSSPADGERTPTTPLSSPTTASPSERGPRDCLFRSSWTADMWVRMTNRVRRASLTRVNSDSLRSLSPQLEEAGQNTSTANSFGHDICTVSLGDFVVVCPISKGAFGRVFLSRERATGQAWALKVLRKHDVMKKNMQHEVFRERDLMELVSHMDVQRQHVVHVKCTFQSQEELFIVQELMPGGDLLSLMMGAEEGCFSEALTRQFTTEIVLALTFLHSMGIIHRDLKPDNILMDASGHLKLTDFGLSEARRSPVELDVDREPNSSHTTGSTRGTIDYMAPELILEQPHGYPVDWWSLGVIIVEFLTGCPPFNADTQDDICQNILNLAVDWDSVPPAATAICRQLLTLDPKVRLGTAGVSEVKAHPYFEGVEWGAVKTAESLCRPAPMQMPEDCVVNFEARRAIFPFRRSDAVWEVRESALDPEDVGNLSFGSEFANFSMELTDLDMPPLLVHRWTSSPIVRINASARLDPEDEARSTIQVPYLNASH